ncbi:cupin domain-containing protein [Dokdonia donghaensis]|uniref:Mannose-6-phosphate isomerase n=1 Tax=Dokdonia donghaensis DSW-1 TaxID=1300343 RepID=A0A0A2GW81_9FLAO|nr:cupin domain-containing protein [Dokdonia donghaensis]ANH59390.1 Cupin domain protein [Dokdonia donghaensis DSW-1]KGO06783.1 mannose-6-phosphate isomerase [Dokdonia donghaensis DSW-1]
MKPINLDDKFTKFDKQWHPHQIATVDDMQVLLAKVSGEFVWHSHKDEDELFFVQKGVLEMRFRESGNPEKEWSEIVHQGEIIVVPKGVEHCPTTKDGKEVHLLLFEKSSTAHTGEVTDAKTQTDYPKI